MNKSKRLPERIYAQYIREDLQKKMVFLGGPRQVGKTTLSTTFIKNFQDNHPAYLNFDNEEHRRVILKSLWSKDEPIIIFDEIHKKKGWQSLIKGFYDTWKNTQKFIITGSARLDLFRKGGDSMLGRYHYYRIHPYSLNELGNTPENLKNLFKFGGFPEPLIAKDERELRRWHLQRVSKLVKVDLRDLENVSDLDKVELLAERVIDTVGNLLSYKSLAEDLEVSDKTVKRWITILDSLYYCYLVPPFGSNKIKAVKKANKLYLWDWSQVPDPSFRFENMVASHLLKFCHFQEDVMGLKTELRVIRDETGKENDFVVIQNKKPLFAIECKLNDTNLSPSLKYLKSKLNIPMWYQVHLGDECRTLEPDLKIISFRKLVEELKLI
ncbi:MAG: ATP-binding protein [Bacteriovoracaceae bacterium]